MIHVVDSKVNKVLKAPESEQTKGILMRNNTSSYCTFSRVIAKFSKTNFPQESSARFRLFLKQCNRMGECYNLYMRRAVKQSL